MAKEATVDHLRAVFGVSPTTAKKLVGLGFKTIEDFHQLDIPKLFDSGLGWATIKKVVGKVKESGLDVVFAVPGHEWDADAKWYELLKSMVEGGLPSPIGTLAPSPAPAGRRGRRPPSPPR